MPVKARAASRGPWRNPMTSGAPPRRPEPGRGSEVPAAGTPGGPGPAGGGARARRDAPGPPGGAEEDVRAEDAVGDRDLGGTGGAKRPTKYFREGAPRGPPRSGPGDGARATTTRGPKGPARGGSTRAPSARPWGRSPRYHTEGPQRARPDRPSGRRPSDKLTYPRRGPAGPAPPQTGPGRTLSLPAELAGVPSPGTRRAGAPGGRAQQH